MYFPGKVSPKQARYLPSYGEGMFERWSGELFYAVVGRIIGLSNTRNVHSNKIFPIRLNISSNRFREIKGWYHCQWHNKIILIGSDIVLTQAAIR